MIMEKMPGRTLADACGDLSFSAKVALVHRIASFYTETFDVQIKAIVSLFEVNSPMSNHLAINVPTKGNSILLMSRRFQPES